jgi:hypothetical protein
LAFCAEASKTFDSGTPLYEEGSRMDYVDVHIQERTGVWVTVSSVFNDLQRIGFELRSVASRYPDRRVRAIDKSGRLIDLI